MTQADDVADPGSLRETLRALPVFAGDLPVFRPDTAPAEPVALFTDWLFSAIEAGVPEPHAAVLATVDEGGRPSSRALICKDVRDDTWYVASSARSRKGREIAANPAVALTFYWPGQGRQIRVRGRATSAGAEAGAADFRSRPLGSRTEALAGRQSAILEHPDDLAAAVGSAQTLLAREPDLVAEDWTLYAVRASDVEFWQADKERRHIRLRYERDGERWSTVRLWP